MGSSESAATAACGVVGVECAPNGFRIPEDVMQFRTLGTSPFSAAGALVINEPQGQSMIEMLRNNMVVAQLGARILNGLVGNLPIPSQTGGATASWLSETATSASSNQTVGQLTLTPHRLAAETAYTYQLLQQSSIDLEEFVRNDLMTILAIARDKAALVGLGSAGEPQGIVNLSNLATSVTLTNAGTITYADAVRFETNLLNSNALLGSLGFVTTPTVRGGTKLSQLFSGSQDSRAVWDATRNTILDYPARATLQLTGANTVVFGNWNDLLLAQWTGSQVVVDPYTLAGQGQIRIVMQTLVDHAVRHTKSFALSTN